MVKLARLIRTIEHTPVSIGFLKKIVGKGVAVLHYKQLKAYNRAQLFKSNRAVIVLIPHRKLKKGHFICLLPKPKGIEYFSSLGMSPSEELVKLGGEDNYMSRILGKTFIYNRTRLQNMSDYSVNTCGAFVFARAKFHKLKQREFLQLFTRLDLQNPDDIVSALVLLSFMDS